MTWNKSTLKPGMYLTLKDYDKFSDYRRHRDQIAQVISYTDEDNVRVEWSDGEESNVEYTNVATAGAKRQHKSLHETPKKAGMLVEYQPGSSVSNFVGKLLKKGNIEESRRKWLRTFQNCVLPPGVKDRIDEALTVVLNSKKFDEWGINEHFEKGVTNAILLYGPPGTGKTMVSESIAAVLGKNLMRIDSSSVNNAAFGQTEQNIKKVFTEAKKNDAVILFDECDSLLSDRNMVGTILGGHVNILLSELERFDGVVVLTTNRLHRLDPALQRRIIAKVELPPPTLEARQQIWRKLVPEKMPVSDDVDFDDLAELELTGGEIKNAILLAARKAIAKNADEVTKDDFEEVTLEVAEHKATFSKTRPKTMNYNEVRIQGDSKPTTSGGEQA